MGRQEADETGFAVFVAAHEQRLRQAFTALWGPDRGREIAIDSLSYGWENWDRVRLMDNPVGYLYVVGRERSSRNRWRREQPVADFVVPSESRSPWYEPTLPALLGKLSDRERQVVVLVHGFDWSLSEVAELLEVSKSTAQTYADRALKKLRSGLGVRT